MLEKEEETDKVIKEAFDWYRDIMNKYPPFNPKNHIPLSFRYPDLSVKELWKLINQ